MILVIDVGNSNTVLGAMKDGEELVTALSEEQCISGTRFYLKGRQEGWSSNNSRVVNDGVVGGKL